MKSHGSGSLALEIGPAGSRKTARALEEYAAALRGGPGGGFCGAGGGRRVLWIAPTRVEVHNVREALVDLAGAVLEPGVATFSGWAGEIVRLAAEAVVPITALQRRRLLGTLVAGAAAAGRLVYYA